MCDFSFLEKRLFISMILVFHLIATMLDHSYLWAQSKRLQYQGFVCDVYGSRDQTQKVLDNDDSNLAYDFNVTELNAGSYVAVFHAEPYGKDPGCAGDSVAVRYANSPDGYFGNRTGNCPDCPGDHVITRTQNPSRLMYSNECGGAGAISGGGNPILIKKQGMPEWALFYLSVADYNEAINNRDGQWRHYLMLAQPENVSQMTSSNWYALSRNAMPADYWHFFSASPPKLQSYQPWPVRVRSNHALLQASFTTPDAFATLGLIGSMSYDANQTNIHFFYMDSINGQPVTRRQETVDLSEVNWWRDPTTIRNGWIEASFHQGRQKWAVLSNCADGDGVDLCLQFTNDADVNSINGLPGSNVAEHGLGLGVHFNDHRTNGIMEQFGFLKNPYGQIPRDDFRVYVTERNAPTPTNADGLYGMDMYSVRINCFCQPNCNGRQCGDDGCGGSCGGCSGDRFCDGNQQCSCANGECAGTCCGAGQICANNTCCAPNCNGRECGDDGCGGPCGGCGDGLFCDNGQCVPGECMPECGNRACGPDSLCGVSCGECAQGEICNRYGKCKNPVMEDMGSLNGGNGGDYIDGGNDHNINGENANIGIGTRDMGSEVIAEIKPIGCESQSASGLLSLWMMLIFTCWMRSKMRSKRV